MVTKSSREMQKDREKIRPPFGGLKFCQGTHYLPLTILLYSYHNKKINKKRKLYLSHTAPLLLILVTILH